MGSNPILAAIYQRKRLGLRRFPAEPGEFQRKF